MSLIPAALARPGTGRRRFTATRAQLRAENGELRDDNDILWADRRQTASVLGDSVVEGFQLKAERNAALDRVAELEAAAKKAEAAVLSPHSCPAGVRDTSALEDQPTVPMSKAEIDAAVAAGRGAEGWRPGRPGVVLRLGERFADPARFTAA